jgi:DNA (cytosine-5)-methyltransferase 1
MNHIDLFAGIGGFALGAYMAGMKFDKHYFSEIDPYCVELYQKRFPDSIPLGDITKIDTKKLKGNNFIITGGFPCQDISVAGKGAGIEGKRSGLWFEMWRIISDLRPKFAIMENVGAITFRGLKEVLGSLHEIGYNAEWQDIRASDMGAPHRRERIWVIAYPSKIRLERQIQKHASNKKLLQIKSSNSFSTRIIDKRRNLQRGNENLRKDSRISNWMDRIKGIGNSIVPQIAELLFRQIKSLLMKDLK